MDTDSLQSTPTSTLVRLFGWSMLAALVTWLTNQWLIVSKGWPGVTAAFSGEAQSQSFLQMGVYAVGLAFVLMYVLSSPNKPLRTDAAIITRFNTWFIRGCFWAVLLVGLADMAISFLRVEGLLHHFFSEDMIKELGRSQYRGSMIHMPLVAAGFLLALVTRTIGFHWLALLIVIAELAIVITRFIFSYEQAFMGDLVRFWYAALFLFASAYTLLHEGHVRVDVFYHGLNRRSKGRVNAVGAVLLGMSLCWTIILIGFKGKSSIIYGPVANFEVSQSGFGMYTKYLMAAFLGVFAISMLVQFVSQLFDAYADMKDKSAEVEEVDDPNYVATPAAESNQAG